MKRTIILVALIIATSVPVLGQASGKKPDKNDKAKKEVVALAKEYANALVKRDATTMGRILADDYGDVSTIGLPTLKHMIVEFFKEPPAGSPRLEAINFDDNRTFVRVYDNAAVLITKITLKWQGSKEELAKKWASIMPLSDAYIVTLVAVKKNGNWQIVSTHESEDLALKGTVTKD